MEKHLNMSQRCTLTAQKASRFLGCTNRSAANKQRDAILPLYSVLFQPHLEDFVEYLGPQHKTDLDLSEHEMVREMEHLSYKHRLREPGLVSLGKRRLQETL